MCPDKPCIAWRWNVSQSIEIQLSSNKFLKIFLPSPSNKDMVCVYRLLYKYIPWDMIKLKSVFYVFQKLLWIY